MAFQSFASERFWRLYSELPVEVQRLASKQYELFREDPFHPSLHLKQVGEVWSVRIGHPTGPSATGKATFSAGAGSARTKRTTSFCGG
jgi:hypothetical protein